MSLGLGPPWGQAKRGQGPVFLPSGPGAPPQVRTLLWSQ